MGATLIKEYSDSPIGTVFDTPTSNYNKIPPDMDCADKKSSLHLESSKQYLGTYRMSLLYNTYAGTFLKFYDGCSRPSNQLPVPTVSNDL